MALPTLTPSLFTGDIDLSQVDYQEADMQIIIDNRIKQTIREVCDDQAYLEIADESKQKWTDLLEGSSWTNDKGKLRINDGLNYMILRFAYFDIVRYSATQVSPAGSVTPAISNSTPSTGGNIALQAKTRYNDAVLAYKVSVKPFIDHFSKLDTEVSSQVVTGGGTVYELEVGATTYLYDGDTVTIEGTDYTVDSVDDTTHFTVTAVAGLDFTGDTVTYEPFEDFNLPDLKSLY